MTREQQRASHAYARVEAIDATLLSDYRILVNSFGPNVMRDGLAMALAFIERETSGPEPRSETAKRFLSDLAGAGLPGVPATAQLPAAVRTLDTMQYMLVTREVLRLSVWFRRAVQARPAPAKAQP